MNPDAPPPLSPYAGMAARIRPQGSADEQAYADERASRPPVLRIALRRGTVLLRFATEPCQVLVDGEPIGELSSCRKFESLIPAGEHAVSVAAGRLRSAVVNLRVENGDIAQYLVTGHNSLLDLLFGLTAWHLLVLPQRFFRLQPFRG